MSAPRTPVQFWNRIVPSLAVLGAVAGAFVFFGVPMYFLGAWEDEAHYLKNYRTPYETEARLSYMLDYCLNSTEANDVIFLGGSGCFMGIDPCQFQRLTGLTAYNLGSWGSLNLDGLFFAFRSYLRHHPQPRILVLCIDTAGFPVIHEDSVHFRSHLFRYYAKGVEEFQPAWEQPAYYYLRVGILTLFGYARGGLERRCKETMPAWEPGHNYYSFGKVIRDQRGFFSNPPGSQIQEVPQICEGVPFTEMPGAEEQLRALAQFTQKRGILLLIQPAPLATTFRFGGCSGDGQPTDVLRCRWLDDLVSEHAGMVVNHPEIPWYPPELCWGTSHCNRKGAEQFTQMLAQEVMRLLANHGKAHGSGPPLIEGEPRKALRTQQESRDRDSVRVFIPGSV